MSASAGIGATRRSPPTWASTRRSRRRGCFSASGTFTRTTVPKADGGLADHRPLGAGVCPWRAFAGQLAERGFVGRVVFEHDPVELGWRSMDDMSAALKPGMDALRRIFSRPEGGGRRPP